MAQIKATYETTSEATMRSVGVQRLVIRFTAWRKRRHAKRLYRRIWKANEIILRERHGSDVSAQNCLYWGELEACADSLEEAAIIVKRGFRVDA